ncbi:Os08g0332400 [Oryza sativa Japonica Group]|uniref:Os08g0332400 protein n=1 Tax=Oryza sativa subsp. japonica TaxID=39947 RepID=A0A0N7KPN8_ORYSJ|nr:hypothetical protein EE612_043538 [Oryza sativa]BAT04938.1 Os08g0332400 [Oryza sativa Japonica Group]
MMVDQLRKLHAFLPDGLLASSQAYASEFCRKEHQALEISLVGLHVDHADAKMENPFQRRKDNLHLNLLYNK